MIEITRDQKEVVLKVETGLEPKANVFLFKWNCNDECYATLLRDHMHERLNRKLAAIREEAYLQGWKDAKAKTAKKTWFSRWW